MRAGGGIGLSQVLAAYTVMQQNTWSGRVFYTAQERRTGQVFYWVEDPTPGSLEPLAHEAEALPALEVAAAEGDVRWLRGPLPDGEPLEDLRSGGRLSETDVVTALLTVIDGLLCLSALVPPLVPSYLDPACIRRNHLGRWVLDYLALAHAPEARMAPSEPLGVQPVGVLLYWLVTGQTARRTRVQVRRLPPELSPALQFIIVKCLGRSYPSLAELRRDLVRASAEHEFGSVMNLIDQQRQRTPKPGTDAVRIRVATVRGSAAQEGTTGGTAPDRVPGLTGVPTTEREPKLGSGGPPTASVTAGTKGRTGQFVLPGGPYIPIDDRPWAPPPRPQGGFRQIVLPPPSPHHLLAARWARLGVAWLLTSIVAGGVAVQAGLVPPEFLPAFLRAESVVLPRRGGAIWDGASSPSTPPVPVVGPLPKSPSDAAVSQLPATQAPKRAEPTVAPVDPTSAGDNTPNLPTPAARSPHPVPEPRSTPSPEPEPTPPPRGPELTPPITAPPVPEPVKPRPSDPEPVNPGPPPLESGSIAYLDATAGGLPFEVYLDSKSLGWAYLFPNAKGPYLSLGAFNALFGRGLYWAPESSGQVRIYTGTSSFVTTDFELARERVWLQLTPSLQRLLNVQLRSSASQRIEFASR